MDNPTMTSWGHELVLPGSPGRDHIRGPVGAPVTLVEYGDYQCPYCGTPPTCFSGISRSQRSTPTPWWPPRRPALGASSGTCTTCCSPTRPTWHPPQLVARAVAVGLDVDSSEVELVNHDHAPKVQEDFRSGVGSGVTGTPTFFVDGARYTGPTDVAHLTAAVTDPLVTCS